MLFVVVFALLHGSVFGVSNLTLGVLLDWSNQGWSVGKTIGGAIDLAIDEINANSNLLPHHHLNYVWKDAKCSRAGSVAVMLDMWKDSRIDGWIGPGCSIACEPTNLIASHWGTPQVSYACASPALSDKTTYPLFSRTVGPWTKFWGLYAAILKRFGWKKVALVGDTSQLTQLTLEAMSAHFAKPEVGIEVVELKIFDPTAGRGAKLPWMRALKEKVNVWVVVGYAGDYRDVMLTASDLGMTGGDYVFILAEASRDYWRGTSAGFGYEWMANDGRDAQSLAAFHSMLVTTVRAPVSQAYATFKQRVADRMRRPPWSCDSVTAVPGRDDVDGPCPLVTAADVNGHAQFLYDAVYAYARALHKVLAAGGRVADGAAISAAMRGPANAFQSISGLVSLDANGDRDPDFVLTNWVSDAATSRASFTVLLDYFSHTGQLTPRAGAPEVQWPSGLSGTANAPPDSPPPPPPLVRQPLVVSHSLLVAMAVLCAILAAVALALLVWNTAHRKLAYIRFSSPNINNVIIIGLLLAMLGVLLLGVDASASAAAFAASCSARLWLMSIGFTLGFGSLAAKTYRVHKVFSNAKMRRIAIKDSQLFRMVGALLLFDCLFLGAWCLADPPLRSITELPVQSLPDRRLQPLRMQCVSKHFHSAWVGALLVEKGLLLFLSAFLAYDTRHVKLQAMNDSKPIGMCIYNICVVLALVLPLSSMLQDNPNAGFLIPCIGVLLVVSTVLFLLFVPKILKVRAGHGDDPMGGTVAVAATAKSPYGVRAIPTRLQRVHPTGGSPAPGTARSGSPATARAGFGGTPPFAAYDALAATAPPAAAPAAAPAVASPVAPAAVPAAAPAAPNSHSAPIASGAGPGIVPTAGADLGPSVGADIGAGTGLCVAPSAVASPAAVAAADIIDAATATDIPAAAAVTAAPAAAATQVELPAATATAGEGAAVATPVAAAAAVATPVAAAAAVDGAIAADNSATLAADIPVPGAVRGEEPAGVATPQHNKQSSPPRSTGTSRRDRERRLPPLRGVKGQLPTASGTSQPKAEVEASTSLL